MSRWLIAALVALGVALLAYDPNVPRDAEDYWVILFLEKMTKFSRLKRFFLGGSVVQGEMPLATAPTDPSINNFKSRLEDVDVRIYDPIARGGVGGLERGPLLIYIHGGGWVKGSVDIYDLTTYHLSKALPSYLVVSVDYRLAPAHPYPAGLEDIDVVYRFLVEHADSYKVDVNRIVIAGDSAGGNLAAAYCLKLRDANRKAHVDAVVPMPKLQALIYPALQAVDLETPSYQSFTPLLSKTAMAAYWTLYLTGSEDGHDQLALNQHRIATKVRNSANRYVQRALIPHHLRSSSSSSSDSPLPSPADDRGAGAPVLSPSLASKIDVLSGDPYFSPLIGEDLTDLPKAYVIACEYDVLRDDAILYSRRLNEAGVEAELRIGEKAWHGIMFRSDTLAMKKGDKMTEDMVAFISDSV